MNGTTMEIKDAITPNLVGVDIGCGMLTIKLKNKDVNLKKLDNVINTKVPSGFNVHSKSKKTFVLKYQLLYMKNSNNY